MSAPQKATGPDRANDQPRQVTTHRPEIVHDDDDLHKIEQTLIAQFAIHGHSTHRLSEGGFVVCKWGQTRHCRDLHALMTFARQVGVRS